jgi:hypothetical protein
MVLFVVSMIYSVPSESDCMLACKMVYNNTYSVNPYYISGECVCNSGECKKLKEDKVVCVEKESNIIRIEVQN